MIERSTFRRIAQRAQDLQPIAEMVNNCRQEARKSPHGSSARGMAARWFPYGEAFDKRCRRPEPKPIKCAYDERPKGVFLQQGLGGSYAEQGEAAADRRFHPGLPTDLQGLRIRRLTALKSTKGREFPPLAHPASTGLQPLIARLLAKAVDPARAASIKASVPGSGLGVGGTGIEVPPRMGR